LVTVNDDGSSKAVESDDFPFIIFHSSSVNSALILRVYGLRLITIAAALDAILDAGFSDDSGSAMANEK
jgi:hypothetical protein